MRPRLAMVLCGLCLLGGLGWQPAWGDTDKTIVDLERGPAAPPARYARPRWARIYRYDKTDMDFATPLTESPNGSQVSGAPQNPPNGPAIPTERRTGLTAPPESGR
jgi:hypothetical protein